MAAQMIGSVGVRQAEIAKHDIISKRVNRTFSKPFRWYVRESMTQGLLHYSPATTTQPRAMVGTTMIRRLLECLAK